MTPTASASVRSTTGPSSSGWPRRRPYFMSVMNRPDGGPQPRHAIERDGDDWTATGTQVVSGAFRVVARAATASRSNGAPSTWDPARERRRVEFVRSTVADAVEPYANDAST